MGLLVFFSALEELYICSLNILNSSPIKLLGLQPSFESVFIEMPMYSVIIEVFDNLQFSRKFQIIEILRALA